MLRYANRVQEALFISHLRSSISPETVESLFIAWRLTGDARYRRYAWSIFSSIEKYCKVPSGGYATVLDVDTVPVSLLDKQETFFLVRLSFILLRAN